MARNTEDIELDPLIDSEYYRGMLAHIEWLIADNAAADSEDTPRPNEPSPSQFWAGWNAWYGFDLSDEELVRCRDAARKRYEHALVTPSNNLGV